jgi:hypothetical protein
MNLIGAFDLYDGWNIACQGVGILVRLNHPNCSDRSSSRRSGTAKTRRRRGRPSTKSLGKSGRSSHPEMQSQVLLSNAWQQRNSAVERNQGSGILFPFQIPLVDSIEWICQCPGWSYRLYCIPTPLGFAEESVCLQIMTGRNMSGNSCTSTCWGMTWNLATSRQQILYQPASIALPFSAQTNFVIPLYY